MRQCVCDWWGVRLVGHGWEGLLAAAATPHTRTDARVASGRIGVMAAGAALVGHW